MLVSDAKQFRLWNTQSLTGCAKEWTAMNWSIPRKGKGLFWTHPEQLCILLKYTIHKRSGSTSFNLRTKQLQVLTDLFFPWLHVYHSQVLQLLSCFVGKLWPEGWTGAGLLWALLLPGPADLLLWCHYSQKDRRLANLSLIATVLSLLLSTCKHKAQVVQS